MTFVPEPDAFTPDYSSSSDPDLQPYRDHITGEVVTLTPAHCAAIRRALDIWLRTAPDIPDNAFLRDAVKSGIHALSAINLKSCLMGRLLYDGLPPLVDAPPVRNAAPDYSVEASSTAVLTEGDEQ